MLMNAVADTICSDSIRYDIVDHATAAVGNPRWVPIKAHARGLPLGMAQAQREGHVRAVRGALPLHPRLRPGRPSVRTGLSGGSP